MRWLRYLYPEGHRKEYEELGSEMSVWTLHLAQLPSLDRMWRRQPEAVAQKGNTRVVPWVGDVLTKWRLGLKWDKVGSGLSPNPTPGLWLAPVLPPLPCIIHQSLPYM